MKQAIKLSLRPDQPLKLSLIIPQFQNFFIESSNMFIMSNTQSLIYFTKFADCFDLLKTYFRLKIKMHKKYVF